jgi:nitrite reductase/ring-hydroxylating ferredoxin subunit
MKQTSRWLVLTVFLLFEHASGFSLVMMGVRRGKGGLKRNLDSDTPKNAGAMNQGKGQEITGVSLPAPGKIKGWEFGESVKMACANVDGNLYAVQGNCPRCGFDLWKGDLITDEAFEDLPRVACPTCSTTFGLRSGLKGPPLKRKGLQGIVGGLAKTATKDDSHKDAQAFLITRGEDDGRVYCRERTKR